MMFWMDWSALWKAVSCQDRKQLSPTRGLDGIRLNFKDNTGAIFAQRVTSNVKGNCSSTS